ncbi:MAG: hypothetical protein ACFHWX_05955 [Bacteroidota bacterium]
MAIITSLLIKLLILTGPVDSATQDLIKVIDEISDRPTEIAIENKLDIESSGGHLQGIQLYENAGKDYFFWSGSSSKYGYLAVADQKEVRRLHKLEYKPLKHAGGFQISDSWLAVGVEDNEARNTSRIHIYKLEKPFAKSLNLMGIIERTGEWERATAGAVAIYEADDSILILVGDWSNRHIDFYRGDKINPGGLMEFKKTGELEMETCSKDGWIDPTPWPYQNINLIDFQGKLFLFGFSAGPKDENLMDIYSLDNYYAPVPDLKKVYTRSFEKTTKTQFIWGAGITLSEENSATILVCGRNITNQTVVTEYSSKK